MRNDRINVTKTFLPPLSEYQKYLSKIWESGQLTNEGALLHELEGKLSEYLGVKRVHFVTNGTLALQLALHALDIDEGEVITTPFSYVATTSSILWQRCKPVFVDIENVTFCIDVEKIEAAITEKTKAILAVHVFGNPCNVLAIEDIAKRHNLKVIYDAAHAFGVNYRGKSLLDYGDISICSFHATKLFHTIEGGALIAKDEQIGVKIDLIKRFGHNVDDHIMLGINAKASELQAAMGLVNLKYVDKIIDERKELSELYTSQLQGAVQLPKNDDAEVTYNYAYYPVVFKDDKQRKKVTDALNNENIFPRRYFYPSLNKLPYISCYDACPNSENIASRIVCLPLYVGLEKKDVIKICNIIKKNA